MKNANVIVTLSAADLLSFVISTFKCQSSATAREFPLLLVGPDPFLLTAGGTEK
jgi:hypothetical protein